LGARASLVDRARVLAITSTPAEAKPGDPVAYSALYVGPTGELPYDGLTWAVCDARKPLVELGPVAPECLSSDSTVSAIGSGQTAQTSLDMDDCRLFGPDTPVPMAGQPAGRPVDPDPSGGYYAPVRLRTADDVAFGSTRLECGLTSATQDSVAAYGRLYHPNANPQPAIGTPSGVVSTLKAAPSSTLTLRASWPACTDVCGDMICSADEDAKSCPGDCSPPIGCDGAETYVLFDAGSQSVVATREAMSASWFSTDGTFASDRTGVLGDDPTTFSDVTWTAPSAPTTVFVWVVLRDDRGGVGYARLTITVG
jgi:hypothetical protein